MVDPEELIFLVEDIAHVDHGFIVNNIYEVDIPERIDIVVKPILRESNVGPIRPRVSDYSLSDKSAFGGRMSVLGLPLVTLFVISNLRELSEAIRFGSWKSYLFQVLAECIGWASVLALSTLEPLFPLVIVE